jgi:uncharacterized protein (TIGR04255 family)
MTFTLPKLSHAPVISIVGQIRFSPVLSMESYLPKIQEEFRKKGFPKFDKVAQQSITFRLEGSPMPPAAEYSWRFSDRDDSRIVTLGINAVTLQSAVNQTAQEFDSALLEAISTVKENVEPDLILRIGLRYINVIQSSAEALNRGDGKPLSAYIQEGLLGIALEEAGAKSSVWHLYSINQTNYGILIFQGRYPLEKDFLPPDFGPNLKTRPLREGCPSFVLDLDHFAELNEPFALGPIKTTLKNFHSVIDRAFTSAVTQSALEEWR